MEDYLQNMKNLRFQMNDFEDQAANVSVEEEKQKTLIQTTERDLELVRSETKRLQEEINQMLKEDGQISCKILQKQKTIITLEAESLTLSQTLDLLQQETASVSLIIEEKRAYYTKVVEDISTKLLVWQKKPSREMDSSNGNAEILEAETNEKYKDLLSQLESAKCELEEITKENNRIASENCKAKQTLEQLQLKLDDFPPELREMELTALEEEQKALLSDKAQEMEYLQSLKDRVLQLKGISHAVKCDCGEEYQVELTG